MTKDELDEILTLSDLEDKEIERFIGKTIKCISIDDQWFREYISFTFTDESNLQIVVRKQAELLINSESLRTNKQLEIEKTHKEFKKKREELEKTNDGRIIAAQIIEEDKRE